MVRKTAALVALIALAGCGSKPPPTSGVGALQLKEPVWATYAWSRNRMNYVIFFTPNPGVAFNSGTRGAAPMVWPCGKSLASTSTVRRPLSSAKV